jgi:predicted TIM-barrel fold metal-dependent hydrolase
MPEVMGPQAARVDASVHPNFPSSDDIRDYLRPPWRNRGISGVEKSYYAAPGGDYGPGLNTGADLPASDPKLVSRRLFDEQGLDAAVLLPIGRGMNPDRRLVSAVCAAINDWQAERWLAEGNPHGRFRGSVRVNPADADGAIREIERWADHPLMVQIVIPIESREPYGKPQFWPIWEAAARYRLPVATHIDGGVGADSPPTLAGSPRTHAMFAALAPLNAYFHLFSLIAEGVFERFADLVFVFGDGGGDFLTPLVWRYDSFYRANRDQVAAWSPQSGSAYLADHVRFLTSRCEGPPTPTAASGWYDYNDVASLLMYASHYPNWSLDTPDRGMVGLADDQRERVFGANAADLYGIRPAGRLCHQHDSQ